MSGNKRMTADPLIIGSLERADSALREMCSLQRQLDENENALNEALDTLKHNAAEKAAPLLARQKALMSAMGVYAKLNRKKLFAERKSLDRPFGVFGFRQATKIQQVRGVSAERSLELLKENGIQGGIRIKEELDKDAMKGWPDERLELIGLARKSGNKFFVELKQETLNQA